MSRDPWQLKVFVTADALVIAVYRATSAFPPEERYGLQSQIRRAAVSVTANLVEGCARPSKTDYMRFVSVAVASASEARYLIGLAARLELVANERVSEIVDRYDNLIRGLQSLHAALRGLKSGAQLRPEV
jgi:four helix bundle protein